MTERVNTDAAAYDSPVFNERGLIPAVLQDAETGEVLMVAWMNRDALRLTQETGQAHFWSRSRQTLWHKGATSGNFMNVREMRIDCDGDTLLVLVDPEGPACHTGRQSCFYRALDRERRVSGYGGKGEAASSGSPGAGEARRGILDELFAVIRDRKRKRPAGSYTSQLFDAGEDEILKKVGEEAMEVMLAAKGEGDARLVSEVADLAYHLLVLLASRGLEPVDVAAELRTRRR